MNTNPMKLVFGTVSSAFGSIPGLLALMTGLGVPPGQNALFGAAIESFGALTLLALWVNRRKIGRVAIHKLTMRAIVFGCGGLVCVVAYMILFPFCVVTCPGWDPVLLPLRLSGKLAQMVAEQGGRVNALCKYGYGTLHQEALNGTINLAITVIIMLIVYAAISVCLAAAFGVLAVRSSESTQKDLRPE